MGISWNGRTHQRLLFPNSNGEEAIENGGHKRRIIGDFYEYLTVHVLGGVLASSLTDVRGDILHDGWNMILEVKGCGNDHSFKIFTGQLDDHLVSFDEPSIESSLGCAYCLWCYVSNTWHGPSLTANIKTKSELHRHLALYTRRLYVVDAVVLDALRESNGTYISLRASSEAHTLRLNRTILRALEYEEGLSLVGLEPSGFCIERYMLDTEFEGYKMRFIATFVLFERMRERIRNTLKHSCVEIVQS